MQTKAKTNCANCGKQVEHERVGFIDGWSVGATCSDACHKEWAQQAGQLQNYLNDLRGLMAQYLR